MINTIIKKMFPAFLTMRPVKIIGLTLFIALNLCQPIFAHAQNQRWYQVEIIAFSRLVDDSQEHWPTNIKLSYPLNWVELKDPDTTTTGPANTAHPETTKPIDLLRDPFYVLPDADKKLLKHAAALKRDSRYRVLFHEAWRQFIGEQKKAPAILISGGGTHGTHQELEGSVTLSVAQYLQLQTRLWLSQFEINYGQAPGEWPKLPKMPNKLKAELLAANLEQSAEPSPINQWSTSATTDKNEVVPDISEPYLAKRIVLMEQDRRMRSNELHYLDHPLFGLIVQITPYDAP